MKSGTRGRFSFGRSPLPRLVEALVASRERWHTVIQMASFAA
jgi:hypothetical protein